MYNSRYMYVCTVYLYMYMWELFECDEVWNYEFMVYDSVSDPKFNWCHYQSEPKLMAIHVL